MKNIVSSASVDFVQYLYHAATAVVDVDAVLWVGHLHQHLRLALVVLHHPLALLLQCNPAWYDMSSAIRASFIVVHMWSSQLV